ncbi:hypothetical protein GCM10023107_30840 [Actinoplanes octamycinicus]|nr:hypothetical protein Aoc01nite_44550 [Actinoplanes octamycinicus]
MSTLCSHPVAPELTTLRIRPVTPGILFRLTRFGHRTPGFACSAPPELSDMGLSGGLRPRPADAPWMTLSSAVMSYYVQERGPLRWRNLTKSDRDGGCDVGI